MKKICLSKYMLMVLFAVMAFCCSCSREDDPEPGREDEVQGEALIKEPTEQPAYGRE